MLRIFLGFVIPGILHFLTGYDLYTYIILLVVIGEFIDRCEFYLELEFMRPLIQIETDLIMMLKDK